ncbi:MAG: hypothetical protein Ct9H300mP30_0600 [Methanobacteriota archaeon]|nr:MAG: hypothetical protein Ct9H300mP30_0600 [Euryarchaeota archaeon]
MDRKVDLTIAALIFLAGTAGLVSGEDIGGVETTTEIETSQLRLLPSTRVTYAVTLTTMEV